MTIEGACELSEIECFEIGGHDVKHNKDINNLVESVIQLCKSHLSHFYGLCGIASPNSNLI